MSPAEGKSHTVAIIGVGSPFGADRLGWLAVDWLECSELRMRFPDVYFTFELADRPGALVLEHLQGVEAAIIIDAMQAGFPPGSLRAFTHEQLLTHPTELFSSHAFGLAETLALGATLGELPQRLTIIGIEMGDDAGEVTLPDRTAHQLVAPIEELLNSLPRPRRAE